MPLEPKICIIHGNRSLLYWCVFGSLCRLDWGLEPNANDGSLNENLRGSLMDDMPPIASFWCHFVQIPLPADLFFVHALLFGLSIVF